MSATLDPGLGEKFAGRTQRAINPDGTFNVRRRGGPYRHDPYQWLIQMPWGRFMGLVVGFFVALNALFALGYLALGLDNLPGLPPPAAASAADNFLGALFFSVQTFTSVGYGHVYPGSNATGALSSLEGLVGVLTFALATGLLYGRFSRPSARLLFTRQAIISRRPDGLPCLMFRLANQRRNTLIDVSARVLLRSLDGATGNYRYAALPLERDLVNLLPLSWTVVHDITPASPLHGLSAADYQAQDFELLVLVRAYDDTFAQDVHARFSYTHAEIAWNRRFVRAYHVAPDGIAVLDLDKLDDTEASE